MSDTAIPVIDHAARPKRAYSPRGTGKRGLAKRTQRDAASVGVNAGPSLDERAAPAREPAGEEEVTRVSRANRQVDRFALPRHRMKPGRDYQWWTYSVLNAQVDASNLTEIHEGGWRAELAKDWPELVPEGTNPNEPVTRYGQRLYGRPIHLTQEARQEDFAAAEQQKRDRIQGALEGRPKGAEGLADIKGVRVENLGLEVQGEAGTQAPRR